MKVMWMNIIPQISMSPRTQNVTLFENKIFADVIKVSQDELKVDPKSNECPFKRQKKIHRDTEGRRMCEFHFSLFPPKPHTILKKKKKKKKTSLVVLVHNSFPAVCNRALYTAVVPRKLCSILLADATAEHRLFLALIL